MKHPHVATVFGAERRSGLVGLWMELVEGETLEAMLLRVGRFNAREVALIGIDVCSALSAVHAAGLLHRDVKAQNVMRDRNGRLVLMDFGTGRDAVSDEGAFVHDEVGTPLYMAPELFGGGKASVQSDIYSVGVLLYRLVTGSVPIEAHSPESLKAAHLAGQRVRLADVRSDLPLAFIRVVERALSIDPAERYRSAGELEMALSGLLVPIEPAHPVKASGRRLVTIGAALGSLVAGLASVGGGGHRGLQCRRRCGSRSSRSAPATRSRVSPSRLTGLRLAYTSAGRLQVRRMNDVAAVEFEQTQGARDPFWSPDGQWIAFFRGVSVWKVRASGGEPQMVAPARRPSSGSWGPDDTLLYTIDHGSSIVAVHAGGGTPRVIRAQRPGLRTELAWPVWTSDGAHFVYSAISARAGRRALFLAAIADGVDAPDRELGNIASNALVVGDRVFFVKAGQLQAQHLDVRAGALVGEAIPVTDGVAIDPYDAGDAEMSVAMPLAPRPGQAGPAFATVAYVGMSQSPRQMAIVDASGTLVESLTSADTRDMRLSPDGRLVAVEEVDAETGLARSGCTTWSADRASGSPSTRPRTSRRCGRATADSCTSSRRARAAGRCSAPRRMAASASWNSSISTDVSSRTRSRPMVVRWCSSGSTSRAGGTSGSDRWPVAKRRRWCSRATTISEPAISPDGRYLAYSTPESGGQQVWVMPLPADGRRWRVSSDYGREPAWSADGRTLYFHGLNRTLMRASADLSGTTPILGVAQGLFTIPFRGYDMRSHFAALPGGTRFLVNVPT